MLESLTIDDVWEYYYHRADLVMWCFAADQVESRETLETLQTLSTLQQKHIVPVVTKADRIPQDRWPELQAKYRSIYTNKFPQLAREKLRLTICGDRCTAVGYGVDELRRHLIADLAPGAAARKEHATKRFCADSARGINRVVKGAAEQLVKNVQTIADTADEVALVAMRRRRETQTAAQSLVAPKGECLRDHIFPLLEKYVVAGGEGGSTRIADAVNAYLDIPEVVRRVQVHLEDLCRSVQSQALTLCNARELRRVRVGTSGKITTQSFTFSIDIEVPPATQSRLGRRDSRSPPLRDSCRRPWTGSIAQQHDAENSPFASERNAGPISRGSSPKLTAWPAP